MEDLTGKQFGVYQIVGPLGEGGMASVYKAYQPGMDRYVALKVLPRKLAEDQSFVGRFHQEAKILARLQHPHILPVHDFGEAEGFTYIVMPFVQSGTLDKLLKGEPLPLSRISQIISQVGDALDYAHSQGLVHRDIKPSNILIDERGNCLLTDFGIAKMFESTAQYTGTGSILGTPAYMSPEQGRGDPIDSASDIYSLGVVLFELATGRVPYQAETPIAIIFKHIQDPLPPPRTINPNLPELVELVILKALSKQPETRFSSAGEMVRALQSAVQGVGFDDPTELMPPTASGRQIAFSRKWIGAAIVLFFVLFVCLAAFVFGRNLLAEDEATPASTADVVSTEPVEVAGAVASETEVTSEVLVPTDTATPTETAVPSPSATATPTLEPSPTPEPTVEPSPTAVPPTPTQSCPPVTNVFANAWNQVQGEIGCATGGLVTGTVVEENFVGGKMFWREPIDFAQALVIFNNGTWRIFQHAPYQEGSPEYPCADANTPAQSPPTPKRGFGTMWCDISEIRNGLGNATDAERAYAGSMQQFQNGFMLYTDYNSTFVFYNTGFWEVR